jgi:hypothetical protein
MAKQSKARRQRIADERERLKIPPWGLSPSEVDPAPAPSPSPSGTAGFDAWHEAQAQRAEILIRDPTYFESDK